MIAAAPFIFPGMYLATEVAHLVNNGRSFGAWVLIRTDIHVEECEAELFRVEALCYYYQLLL